LRNPFCRIIIGWVYCNPSVSVSCDESSNYRRNGFDKSSPREEIHQADTTNIRLIVSPFWEQSYVNCFLIIKLIFLLARVTEYRDTRVAWKIEGWRERRRRFLEGFVRFISL
jgi:hypothetical protein